jgi:hypothetical protein
MTRALPLLVVMAVLPVSAAQVTSLADTARKTEASKSKSEEERKAKEPAPSFTARDLIGVEWIITRTGFEAYAGARAEMATVRKSRPAVQTRLFEASRTVRSLMDLATPIGTEPLLIQALTKYGLTTREYLRREQAILNASAWAKRTLPESLKNRPIRAGNVDFVRNNDRFVRDQTARYEKAEGSAGEWFNVSRFVEQP